MFKPEVIVYRLINGRWEEDGIRNDLPLRWVEEDNNNPDSTTKYIFTKKTKETHYITFYGKSNDTDDILAMIKAHNKTAKRVPKKAQSRYNKSEIMRNAHALYKAGGYTQSSALKEAWRLAKVETLESQIFMLEMKDRHSHEDRNTLREWRKQLNELAAA